MKNKSTKLVIVTINPPKTNQQAEKMIEHISEILKIKYYS